MLKIGSAAKWNYHKYFFACTCVCLCLSCRCYLVNKEDENQLWFGRYEKLKYNFQPRFQWTLDCLSTKSGKFKSLHELNSARLREVIWFVSICYCKQIYFTCLWSIHGTSTRGNAIADWLWLLTDLKVRNFFLQKLSHQ